MQEMPPALTTAIASVGSAAITLLISLYVRDNARKVVEEALVKVQLDFKKEIKSELTVFKDEFLRSLDTTYRRSAECSLMMEQTGDFQDILAKRADSQEASLRDVHNQLRRFPHNGDV